MRFFLLLAVVAACFVPTAAGAYTHEPFTHVDQPDVWTMGYDAAFQQDLMPIDTIPWDDLTHIAFGPAIPRADGTLNLQMYAGPGTVQVAKDLTAAAKAHDVQPILMLGGAGVHKAFSSAIRNHRATFITNLYKAMDRMGFTGVDLDLEPLTVKDRAPLAAFARGLRRRDHNITLTFPAGPVTTTFPEGDTLSYYANTLGPLVDRISLMTYDMSGAYDGWDSWHFGPLYGEEDCSTLPCHPTSIDFNVKAFEAAGVPKEKLNIGAGFYGACWNPETGPGQALSSSGDHVGSDNDLSYANIVADYAPLMTALYDAGSQQAELYSSTGPKGPDGCTWISYEDPASVGAKAAYVTNAQLGGVIVWTIGEGRTPSGDPLLDALHAGL